MKKYMSYCGQYLQHRNKLENDFKQFIKGFDRQIMDEEEMKMLTRSIIDGVGELNRRHPKCTPIEVGFWVPGASSKSDEELEDSDIIMEDSSNRVVFTILRGKEFLS